MIITLTSQIGGVTIKINIFFQNSYLDVHCLHSIKHDIRHLGHFPISLASILKMLLYSYSLPYHNSKETFSVINYD